MTTRSVGARAAAVVLLSLGLGALALPSLALPAAPPAGAAPAGAAAVGAGYVATSAPAVDGVSDTPGEGELPVVVEVTQIAPAILAPGQDLSLTVTLRNAGTAAVIEPRMIVHLDRRPFISRSSLDRWREADLAAGVGSAVLDVDLPGPLEPGASTTVPAVVPAASLGLRNQASSWGARGLAVEVVDRADPARTRQGLARTFALWFPEQEVTATQVTVLVPLVGPAVDASGTWATEMEALTQPGGRLADVLTVTATRREVTWVIDPLLVEAGTRAEDPPSDSSGNPPTATATPTPDPSADPSAQDEGEGTGPGTAEGQAEESASGGAGSDGEAAGGGPSAQQPESSAVPLAGPGAREWVTALLGAMTNRDVRLLPYGDADVAALAHAGAADVLATAVDRARSVARAAGIPQTASATVVWPAISLPDLATAAFVRGDGSRALLVGPGELLAPGVLTYTPTGRTTVSTRGGDVAVLVPDARLSAGMTSGLVASIPPAEPDEDPPESQPEPWRTTAARQVTGASAGQDLLAELAVITRERPSEARHLLVTVPRDWAPDVSVVPGQLQALSAAPWVRLEPATALIGAPAPEVDRGTLPARSVEASEVPVGEIGMLQSATADREALAQMVEDPGSLLRDVDAEVLVPLSVAWRANPEGRSDLVRESAVRTDALRSAVSVVEPASTVNLLSTTGALRVRVANALDRAVQVTVSLRPGNSRLVADEAVEVTIPAQDEQLVEIPVHAIQSDDVDVAVEVRTPDGVLVDDDVTLTVRVRAEWENIGTAVVAALMALGVVIGLIRTIRRGRTARRAAPVVAGPDALSPEVAGTPPEVGTVEPAGEVHR